MSHSKLTADLRLLAAQPQTPLWIPQPPQPELVTPSVVGSTTLA